MAEYTNGELPLALAGSCGRDTSPDGAAWDVEGFDDRTNTTAVEYEDELAFCILSTPYGMICLSATELRDPDWHPGLFIFCDYTASNTLIGHYLRFGSVSND